MSGILSIECNKRSYLRIVAMKIKEALNIDIILIGTFKSEQKFALSINNFTSHEL